MNISSICQSRTFWLATLPIHSTLSNLAAQAQSGLCNFKHIVSIFKRARVSLLDISVTLASALERWCVDRFATSKHDASAGVTAPYIYILYRWWQRASQSQILLVFAVRCTVISPNGTPGLPGHYTETGARKHSHAPSLLRFDIFSELDSRRFSQIEISIWRIPCGVYRCPSLCINSSCAPPVVSMCRTSLMC